MSLWATWTRICQARGVQSSRSLIVPDVKNGYDLRRRSRWVSAAECNSYQLFRLRCRIKNTRLGTLGGSLSEVFTLEPPKPDPPAGVLGRTGRESRPRGGPGQSSERN